jgi:hypothetical protein
LKKLAEGILQFFPQSWSKIDRADDIVLESYLEQSERRQKQKQEQQGQTQSEPDRGHQAVPKLPSAMLYSIWLLDEQGLRLWLPALDIEGEFLHTRCTDAYVDVVPLGVMESHGIVVGVTQRSRAISKFKVPCFEFSIRVSPTTHAILSWLIRAERSDLAQQVLVQASAHLPLFRETLDLFLFNAVEFDFKSRASQDKKPLLPSVVRLLRTGKVAASVIDNRMYDALVVTCARKMESSRWDLFFAHAGNPEQIFNDAIYNGDLNTAAGSMIIADYFSPQHSGKRLASLAHSAAVMNDTRLLRQIEHFQSTKLTSSGF